MSEIKNQVKKLVEGSTYTAEADSYLITEDHTLADIARFIHNEFNGSEDVIYLLKELRSKPSC